MASYLHFVPAFVLAYAAGNKLWACFSTLHLGLLSAGEVVGNVVLPLVELAIAVLLISLASPNISPSRALKTRRQGAADDRGSGYLGRELPLDVKRYNEIDKFELHYFPSLDNFRKGVPKWVDSNFTMSLHDVRYIPSFRVFVCTEKSSRASDRVIILNESGSRINTLDLPGDMVAVDRRGDSLELFVRRQVRLRGGVKAGELCSILVRSDFNKIGRVNPMYPIQGHPVIAPIGFPFHIGRRESAIGTRLYRFRGLQEGEVSRFFHEVFPSPGYWSYEDLQPVRKRLDQHLAPFTLYMVIRQTRKLAGVQPAGIERLFILNQLEAFEDRDAYEVVWDALIPVNGGPRSLMLNRAGEGIILPVGTGISDAVINEDRKIFVTFTQELTPHGKPAYKTGCKSVVVGVSRRWMHLTLRQCRASG